MLEYLLHQVTNLGIFIILACSLNFISGFCGQLSLGHAGFWAVGAYTSAYYSIYYFLEPLPSLLNFVLAAIVGMTCSALAGFVVGIPALRLKGDYLAICTLGGAEIIRLWIINSPSLGGPRGLTGIPPLAGPTHVLFGVLFSLLILHRLTKGRVGRAIMAIREDEVAAETLGIHLSLYKTFAFVVGASFAGLAGVLFAHTQQFLHPNSFTFMWSVIILVMVIIGGPGRFWGSVMGAIFLTLLPEALRFLGERVAETRMIIYSLILMGLMLWRQGQEKKKGRGA